jgi:hypothetical protein
VLHDFIGQTLAVFVAITVVFGVANFIYIGRFADPTMSTEDDAESIVEQSMDTVFGSIIGNTFEVSLWFSALLFVAWVGWFVIQWFATIF